MKKTIEGEPIVGLQPETVGGHSSTRVGPISAISAVLHYLIHPRARKKTAAETRAETERSREPDRGPGTLGSPMEAGITGGFSLLMDNSHARKRR
jgi:hypothetical protein